MSTAEIEELELAEAELAAKLATLRAQRESLIRAAKDAAEEIANKAALEIPLEITVESIWNNSIRVTSKYRWDLVGEWKKTPGHLWKGYDNHASEKGIGINLIPIAAWKECLSRVSTLPNVSIKYNDGIQESIEYNLYAPPFDVSVETSLRFFSIKIGPRQNPYQIQDIAGASTDWNSNPPTVRVPLSEGWRIPQELEKVEGVVYSEDAKLLIIGQVESRARLDMLAGQEDSTDERLKVLTHQIYDDETKTWKSFYDWLKPRQRVGIEFALETGGRFILSDETGLGKTAQYVGFAEVMRAANPAFMTVICCKASNIPGQRREVKRFTGKDPVICNNGYHQSRIMLEIYKRPSYVIIAHEMMGTYEKVTNEKGEEEKIHVWPNIFKEVMPDCMIVDEAHQIANPSTNRSRAIRELATISHIIPATASPIKNKVGEFWAPLFLVNPTMFKSHDAFIRDYTLDGKRPKNVEKLQELLRPLFLRRTRDDFMKDFPAVHRIQRFTELTEQAVAALQEVEHGIYTSCAAFDPYGKGGDQRDVFHILHQILRYIQIVAADTTDFTAEGALELIDQAEDPKDKVLIFSRFQGTAALIAKKLRDKVGDEAVVCTVTTKEIGGKLEFASMNPDERDALFEMARYDDRIRYIVTTTAAKEGHNMEYCKWVMFNELFWGPYWHYQCEGRAHGRLANPRPIDSFYTMAECDIVKWLWEINDMKTEIIAETVEGIEPSRDIELSVGKELIKKIREHGFSRA